MQTDGQPREIFSKERLLKGEVWWGYLGNHLLDKVKGQEGKQGSLWENFKFTYKLPRKCLRKCSCKQNPLKAFKWD